MSLSLVRLFSSSSVYLYLFWSSWVPSGRCLSLLSNFLAEIRLHSLTLARSCIPPLGPSCPSSLLIGGSSSEESDLG